MTLPQLHFKPQCASQIIEPRLWGGGLNFVSILSAVALVTACTDPTLSHSNTENAPLIKINNQTRVQLIIKFSKPFASPDVEQKLQEISEQTGIELVYVRAMSNDAHVIAAQNISNTGNLTDLINKIKQRDDIEYVETDALVQHQHGQQNIIQQGAVK